MQPRPMHANAPAGAAPSASMRMKLCAVGWQPELTMENPGAWAENTRPEACLTTSRLAIISVAISPVQEISTPDARSNKIAQIGIEVLH